MSNVKRTQETTIQVGGFVFSMGRAKTEGEVWIAIEHEDKPGSRMAFIITAKDAIELAHDLREYSNT